MKKQCQWNRVHWFDWWRTRLSDRVRLKTNTKMDKRSVKNITTQQHTGPESHTTYREKEELQVPVMHLPLLQFSYVSSFSCLSDEACSFLQPLHYRPIQPLHVWDCSLPTQLTAGVGAMPKIWPGSKHRFFFYSRQQQQWHQQCHCCCCTALSWKYINYDQNHWATAPERHDAIPRLLLRNITTMHITTIIQTHID